MVGGEKSSITCIKFRSVEERNRIVKDLRDKGITLSAFVRKCAKMYAYGGFEVSGDRIILCGEYTPEELEEILKMVKK